MGASARSAVCNELSLCFRQCLGGLSTRPFTVHDLMNRCARTRWCCSTVLVGTLQMREACVGGPYILLGSSDRPRPDIDFFPFRRRNFEEAAMMGEIMRRGHAVSEHRDSDCQQYTTAALRQKLADLDNERQAFCRRCENSSSQSTESSR